MKRPRLLDLYCGAGGTGMGYSRAGFDIFGVDNDPKVLGHYPFPCVCADALEYLAEHGHEYDCIHASPPCQGYSVMNNLPWLKDREYPLLILPTLELLEKIDRPYVLENVMGARHGAKGLKKRGLEAHGLKAGWLCGTMFGLPFYRHRLFATNWFWLAPGHPKHLSVILTGRQLKDGQNQVAFSRAEDARGIASWPNRRGDESGHGLTLRQYTRASGKVETVTRTGTTEPGYGLTQYQNNAQAGGVGISHAKGWRLASEAMGISWPITRAELTQMIPPAFTLYIGTQMMKVLK